MLTRKVELYLRVKTQGDISCDSTNMTGKRHSMLSPPAI